MKRIGQFDFPENAEEAKQWQRYTRHIALARDVLVVATTRVEGTWKAYCGSVPGMDHDNEWQKVLRQGSQLPELWASAMFVQFKGVPYAE
jgi:hypothetical protein